ncbi:probable polygalacturonase [Sesamum indicum]|uniref:Probable polygalacturonase n=1 Tax=Sesamum indicum TaxID=4182 RepID=A0A6I9U2V8_SESIN|nr:probable polygalacturonase [Sesamum indicum]
MKWITRNYGTHADNHLDPNALPEINGINYRDVVTENMSIAAGLEGITGDPFTGICIANMTIGMAKKYPWSCLEVEGVVPPPCGLLADQGEEKLAVDGIQLQKCSYRMKYNF